MIQVTNLRKQFGDNEILKGISFDVPDKSILGIIGASGSGKTTLLRCLNGFETINGGTITCGNIKLEAGISAADYKRRVRDASIKSWYCLSTLLSLPSPLSCGKHNRGSCSCAAYREEVR